jgi:hypothetical protein
VLEKALKEKFPEYPPAEPSFDKPHNLKAIQRLCDEKLLRLP